VSRERERADPSERVRRVRRVRVLRALLYVVPASPPFLSQVYVDTFHAAHDENCRSKLGIAEWDNEARVWRCGRCLARRSEGGLQPPSTSLQTPCQTSQRPDDPPARPPMADLMCTPNGLMCLPNSQTAERGLGRPPNVHTPRPSHGQRSPRAGVMGRVDEIDGGLVGRGHRLHADLPCAQQ
jgi:hypothetical protein